MTDEPIKLSPSMRLLKFLVMAMGITMIFGFIFLLSMIYRMVGQEKQADCQETAIELPSHYNIISMAAAERKQHIRLLVREDGEKISILEVNLCDAEIVNRHDIDVAQ